MDRTIRIILIEDHPGYRDTIQVILENQEDMTLIMQQLLFIGDRIFARELKDHVLREALAVVFAGGIEDAGTTGMAEYRRMMQSFMQRYIETCEWLGVKRNPEMMPQRMTQYLPAGGE